MAFPYVDACSYDKENRILVLEYDLSKEMKFHTFSGEIIFEKNEVIKLFETLKFSTKPIIGTVDEYSYTIDLRTAWALIKSIMFPENKVVLTLEVLETNNGNVHDACFKISYDLHNLVYNDFFTSVIHENGKNMRFMTINYKPTARECYPHDA